jgi:large subunit ribosomal protein L25
LVDDPDMLVVNVLIAPTAEELESEGAGEVAEGEEPAEEGGEAEESEASESETESE